MPQFHVNQAFEFGGLVRREGTTLTVDKAIVQEEIGKGKHIDTGRPTSGLLNHCSPADDATAEMIEGFTIPKAGASEMTEEEQSARVEEIKKEMTEMGKAYDGRWKLKRFEMELKRAKKEAGA